MLNKKQQNKPEFLKSAKFMTTVSPHMAPLSSSV